MADTLASEAVTHIEVDYTHEYNLSFPTVQSITWNYFA